MTRAGAALTAAWLAVAAVAGCGDDPPPAGAEPVSPPYVEAAKQAIAPPAAPPGRVRLADATPGSGLEGFRHTTGGTGKKYFPETLGPGAALVDVDDDGRLDVVVADGDFFPGQAPEGRARPTPRLYVNRGGLRFEDRTEASGLGALHFYGMGVAAADLDADGDQDLLFGSLDGLRVLENTGGGRFRDVSGPSGAAAAAPGWVTSLALLDVDRDGRLDVFCCRYVKWSPETDLFATIDGVTKAFTTPRGYEGLPPRLLRNASASGQGIRLEDVSTRAGIGAAPGKSLGAVVDDLDGDGVLDIAVADDTEPNALLRGRGDGTYVECALEAGFAYDEEGRARAGMGIDTVHVAPAGRPAAEPRHAPAIAIGNFSREPVGFFVADLPGSLLFRDLAAPAGIARPSLLVLTFGLRFLDADLDLEEDLLLANGHIEPEVEAVEKDVRYAQPLQLYRGLGGGRYALVPPGDGGDVLARPLVGRALATGDLDGDGDEDALVTTNGGPLLLVRNDRPPGHRSLRIDLESRSPGNRRAVGAIVTLHVQDRRLRRTVKAGASYLSQGDLGLTFGLGEGPAADRAHVIWPDGRLEAFDLDPEATALRLRQGAGVRPRVAPESPRD